MKALTKLECIGLLQNNYIGHLAYIKKGIAETLPITYFFDEENQAIVSYAAEGEKIKSMREHPQVSFQVEEVKDLQHWRSVLLYGRFEELKGVDAKNMLHVFAEGVRNLLSKKENTDLNYLKEFSSKVEASTDSIVYRINITKVKGKQRDD